jgi:hypothetical protein
MPKLQAQYLAYSMHNKHSDDDLWNPWIAGVVGMVAGGIAVGVYHICGILSGTGTRRTTGSLEIDMLMGGTIGAVAFGVVAVLRNRIPPRR